MSLVLPSGEIFDRGMVLDPNYEMDYAGPKGDFSGRLGLIIGSGDPESDFIANIAYELGIPYVYARVANGRRVSPAEYEAYSARFDERVHRFGQIVSIECKMQGVDADYEIDHHGPRAPLGLDTSWENAIRASSIGQFLNLVGHKPNYSQILMAAYDHAGHRLLNGQFPHIDQADVRAAVVHEVVRGARKEVEPSIASMDEVNASIDEFVKDKIPKANRLELGRVSVVDLRNEELEQGFSERFLVIKLAGSIAGEACVVISQDPTEAKPRRHMLTGLAYAEHIEAFEDIYVPANNLGPAIFDLQRGYAHAHEQPSAQ